MKLFASSALIGAALITATPAIAGSADANLGNFVQSGAITNTSSQGVNIVEVFITFGPASDNHATYDTNNGNSLSGGTAEDSLSDPRYAQSIRWTGLSVAPGGAFNFSGLDMDLIITLNPLSVSGSGGPTTGGYVQALFSDNSVACAALVDQAPGLPQSITLTEANVGNTCATNIGPAPAPTPDSSAEPIPTIGFWGLAILSGLIGLLGLYHRRGR